MNKPLLITALLVAILSFQIPESQAEDGFPSGVLNSPGKRFVFGQISGMARHQYMLDTETGRLWQLVVDEKGSNLLQAVPYITSEEWLSFNAPTAQKPKEEPSAYRITPNGKYSEEEWNNALKEFEKLQNETKQVNPTNKTKGNASNPTPKGAPK